MDGDREELGIVGALRVGREGPGFERVFRALAFVYHGWATFTRKERTFEERDGALRAIPFDKFGLFFVRTWGWVFGFYELALKELLDQGPDIDASGLVTFSPQMGEVVGRHGRGAGRYNGREAPTYLLEIIYDLQENRVMLYFDVRPPTNAPGNPTHPDTTVRPAVEIADAQLFLTGFTAREIVILKDLQNAVRHLNGSQIRALGTHENLDKTLADINWEFNHLVPLLETTGEDLGSQRCCYGNATKLAVYASEAFRKSRGNRDDYETALELLEREVQDPLLKDLIGRRQARAADIWDSRQIKEIAPLAAELWAVARYVQCVAYFRNNPHERDKQSAMEARHFRHQWDESTADLAGCSLGALPPSRVPDAFDGVGGEIRPEVRSRLVDLLTGLRARIPGGPVYA